MENQNLTIKKAAEFLDVPPYMLRYYEGELNLKIERNEQGHRVFTKETLAVLQKILQLKEQGVGLKTMKNLMKDTNCDSLQSLEEAGVTSLINNLQTDESLVVGQVDTTEPVEDENYVNTRDAFLRLIKDNIHSEVVEFGEQIKEELRTELISQVSAEFEPQITNKLVGYIDDKMDSLHSEVVARDEAHFKKLDSKIRKMQETQRELIEKQKEDANKKSSFMQFFNRSKQKKVSIKTTMAME
ncbi:MAG: hypothetical protein ATN35_13255 [Epulopiscium sp. Nele67-Bin004]|nr:MAG: hypothetical protein ATN35_13255 [Epulopiscium sp. Nele67-Bin004]